MLLGVLFAAAAVCVVLWMDRRRAAEFRETLAELHRARASFWRARLQADEPGADGPELARTAHGHLARVRALADRLRTRHRDAAAESWTAGAAFTRELAEMEHAMAGRAWSREAAAERMEHARREAGTLGRSAGGAAERAALLQGLAGAVVCAAVGFLIPFRFARGFFLEDSAGPLLPWTLGGAVVGFMLGALGREAFWSRALPAERQGGSWVRAVVPTVVAVGVIVIAFAFCYGPPSAATKARVMREMVAASGCPRPMPAVRADSVRGLGAVERCALVWTAARALPPTPDARRFAQAGDTAGVLVAWMDELRASNTIDVAPGYAWEGRALHGWTVVLGIPGETGGIYTVYVDGRSGRAKVRQQTLRSPGRAASAKTGG
jgi:hypothetical protein